MTEDETPTPEPEETGSTTPEPSRFADCDFTTTRPGEYPTTLLDREQWMGRLAGEKLPFAPWGDKNHPKADGDTDARYKWGLSENYTDGVRVAIAEDDHRLDGRVFIQRDSDPFAFVDGDDVRCPKTGEVHPAFVELLDRLGHTYADVSTSGSGVHAYYRGDLPGNQGQAVFEIDTEPWGENDAPPTVEIYANTHVCVTTGERVLGSDTDLHEWESDAVESILTEHDARKTDDEPALGHDTDRDLPDIGNHDTDRDRAALDEYEPDATDAGETTADIRDVLTAVDRLDPRDVPLRTTRTGEDSTGWGTWNPSYRSSASGESLHKPPDEPVFYDHKLNESFGVLSLFAAEQDVLSDPWDRLTGADWWNAVEQARDAGAPIPEYDATEATEHVAVLPPAVRDLSGTSPQWGGLSPDHGRDSPTLTLDDARDRTSEAIADAFRSGDRVLVEALPGTGKSFGTNKAVAKTGEPISFLTGRGRKEQYEQIREWCEELGLTHYTLPSFYEDCPTASGQFGEEWQERVRDLADRGVPPREIHARAKDFFGGPCPCNHDGSCTLSRKWDFDPDEYDVLIGHYSHAYREETVVSGRTPVVDEFSGGAYQSHFDDPRAAVSAWLSRHEAIPFDDYTDLIENRDDDARKADALRWFADNGIEPDYDAVFSSDAVHAHTPAVVFGHLSAGELANGWERSVFPSDAAPDRFVRDRATGAVSILRPPDLSYASGLVALDGTPTKRLWELTLGESLNHRQVLSDAEREEYIRDSLNLNLVKTTEHVKPYNSADHVNTERDAALVEAIHDRHDERPGVITTATAVDEYAETAVERHADSFRWYGNVLGSNQYKSKRVGVVIGSNHYGDQFIKRWGAFAGNVVEREGKGSDLSYGAFGDDVLTHMREHETLQAALRFGRDGDGATVYVHTDTLPDWVPTAGEGRVLRTWSDGMREVIDAVETRREWTTAEIGDAVSLSTRQVRDHLHTLVEEGAVSREFDGAGYLWRDDGLHAVNENGAVELEAIDTDDLDAEERAEVARSTLYTWDFRSDTADSLEESEGERTSPSPTPHDARAESETGVSGRHAPD